MHDRIYKTIFSHLFNWLMASKTTPSTKRHQNCSIAADICRLSESDPNSWRHLRQLQRNSTNFQPRFLRLCWKRRRHAVQNETCLAWRRLRAAAITAAAVTRRAGSALTDPAVTSSSRGRQLVSTGCGERHWSSLRTSFFPSFFLSYFLLVIHTNSGSSFF